MHDGITAERRGKPATTVLTRSFEPLARAVRTSMGMESLALAVVPHPLGSGEQMAERVRQALPQIERALVGGGE